MFRSKNLENKRAAASKKEVEEIDKALEGLNERRTSHLPGLIMLRDMAIKKRQVLLPLLDRPIPLIRDEWADPALGYGLRERSPPATTPTTTPSGSGTKTRSASSASSTPTGRSTP